MASNPWHHDLEGRGETVCDHIRLRGDLVSYGGGGGGGGAEATHGDPGANQTPAKHPRACALVPEPPGAAQYTGQLRISRGKQPICEATLPGLSPRGRTTRRLPVHWGLADSQREQPRLEMWRRSQGNTRQHIDVLNLIVVSSGTEHRVVADGTRSC